MFPTMKEQAASVFPFMVDIIRFWCLRSMDHSEQAEMIFKKILSDSANTRFASPEFVHHGNRLSLHFGPNNGTLQVTPWAPMLWCLAQSIHENVSDDCIRTDHLFKGDISTGKLQVPKASSLMVKTQNPTRRVNVQTCSYTVQAPKAVPKLE
jgi:hypothetical protein